MPSEPQLRVTGQAPGELDLVLDIVADAFARSGEEEALARLVPALQASPAFAGQSWLAWLGDRAVGHVMLSRGWIDADRERVPCPVLAPLSVRPGVRGRGIGSALVAHALAEAGRAGAPAVVLEGHPDYYGRFGFEPCEDRGVLRPSTAIPQAAFQWARLAGYHPWMRGRFVYPDAFWVHDAVGLTDWRREEATGLVWTTTTLGARDPRALGEFYVALLGRGPLAGGDDWFVLRDTTAGMSLAFQHEPDQTRPTWPAGPGEQHMQAHLEIRVDDLDGGVAHARSCGASLAPVQLQDDVRVCLDPEGHPFCLWVED